MVYDVPGNIKIQIQMWGYDVPGNTKMQIQMWGYDVPINTIMKIQMWGMMCLEIHKVKKTWYGINAAQNFCMFLRRPQNTQTVNFVDFF